MNTEESLNPIRFLSGNNAKPGGHGTPVAHGTPSEANIGHGEKDACGNPAKHEVHHSIPIASQVLFTIMVALIIG
jgi:NhaP-type Na+/H+ or K+/H+ antiporter